MAWTIASGRGLVGLETAAKPGQRNVGRRDLVTRKGCRGHVIAPGNHGVNLMPMVLSSAVRCRTSLVTGLYILLTCAADAPSVLGADPIDMEPLLKVGAERLKQLGTMAPGDRRETYFEIHMGPDNVMGYVSASLEALTEGNRLLYAYESDTVMVSKVGVQIRAKMEARLLPDFHPLEITMSRGNQMEDKSVKFATVRAVFGEENVTTTSSSGGESGSVDRPKPQPPYIFAIEMLVQALDPTNAEPFALREYSANAGGAESMKFSFEPWRDGNQTLVTRYTSGDLAYQFWYDGEQKLLRWTHVTMPVMFVRSTKERVAEWQVKLGKPMPLEEAAPANTD